MTSTSVRVALRVRPLNNKETIQNCNECLSFIPDAPQIFFGTDRSFTFDYVFPPDTEQEEVFQECSYPLVEKLVEGYNVTILAYGQTGSGKTYSMGMENHPNTTPSDHQGIVPRAIKKLFEDLDERKENIPSYQFEVYVSFLELYNEDLVDLLNPQSRENNKKKRNELSIREDANGQIYWAGVKEVLVSSPEELLGQLQKGSLCRTVASTDMNLVSSRSHAIFSVILKQTKIEDLEENKENDIPPAESSAASKRKSRSKSLTSKIVSKFHFVDLAGSERLKRTNSVGDRAKEGIAINGGLLALGNVISALGDESKKVTHIPYRDSKLTRLLQDSLGGNSQTLMLACVSPADSNFMESLNTLKYANRARNIRNKVSVNESYGGNSVEINQLRGQISRLKMEIQTLRAGGCIEEVSRKFEEEIKLLKGELGMTKLKLNNVQEQLATANAEKNSLLMQIDYNNSDISDADRENKIKTHKIIQKYEAEILNLKNQVADLQAVQFDTTRGRGKGRFKFHSLSHVSNIDTTLEREKDRFKFPTLPHITNNDNIEFVSEKKGKRKKKRSSRKNKARADGHFPISNESSSVPSIVTVNPSKLDDAKHLFSHYIDEEEVEDEENENLNQFDISRKFRRRNKTRETLERVKERMKYGYSKDGSTYDDLSQLVKMPSSTKSESYLDQMVATNRSKERRRSSGVSFGEDQTVDVPSWEEYESDPPSRHRSRHNSNSSHSVSFYDQSFASYSTNSSEDSTGSEETSALNRMLHQIQSDIAVKEQLVSQLEVVEKEYIGMKAQYEQKLNDMQEGLISLQRERDTAVKRAQNSSSGASSRDKNSIVAELKGRYEHKMKRLIQEIGELRRKYNDAVQSNATTKNQNETKLKNMRAQIEQLKSDKSRMIYRMKEEAKRVRGMTEHNQRVIQNLRRKEKAAQEQKKRLERTSEMQKVMLEKRQQLVLQTKGKLKSVMVLLKRTNTPKSIAKAFRNNKRSTGVSHEEVLESGYDKKKILDEAIYKYISGRQTLVMMDEWINKRTKLQDEKKDLLEERERIITNEIEDELDEDAQILDDRIEMINSEIVYINAKIRALQSEAVRNVTAEQEENVNHKQGKLNRDGENSKGKSRKNRKNSNSKTDKVEKRLSVILPENATPETSYDIAVSILRNLDALESQTILESFFKDIVDLRTEDLSRQMTLDQHTKTIMDLRKMLMAMRKAAELAMIEYEKKNKELEESLLLGERSPSPTTPEKRELQIVGMENCTADILSLLDSKLEQALAEVSSSDTIETSGQSSSGRSSYFFDNDESSYFSSTPLSGNLLNNSNRASFSKPAIPPGWLKLQPRERNSVESSEPIESNRSSISDYSNTRRRDSNGSESNQNNDVDKGNKIRRKSSTRRPNRLSNGSSTPSTPLTPLTPSTPKNENISFSSNIGSNGKSMSSRRSSFRDGVTIRSHSRQNSSTSIGFYSESSHDSGNNSDKRRSMTSMAQRNSKDFSATYNIQNSYGRSNSPDSDDALSINSPTSERRVSMSSYHTHTRSETPTGENVFDRLSKSQTHSSSAKNNTSAKRTSSVKYNSGNVTGGHIRRDGGVGEALAALEGRRDDFVKSPEPVNAQA